MTTMLQAAFSNIVSRYLLLDLQLKRFQSLSPILQVQLLNLSLMTFPLCSWIQRTPWALLKNPIASVLGFVCAPELFFLPSLFPGWDNQKRNQGVCQCAVVMLVVAGFRVVLCCCILLWGKDMLIPSSWVRWRRFELWSLLSALSHLHLDPNARAGDSMCGDKLWRGWDPCPWRVSLVTREPRDLCVPWAKPSAKRKPKTFLWTKP